MARAQLLLQTFCQERFCILLLIRKLNGLTESKVKQNNARGGGVGWGGVGGGAAHLRRTPCDGLPRCGPGSGPRLSRASASPVSSGACAERGSLGEGCSEVHM